VELWKLVRNETGYSEPEAMILAAENEDQARRWAVRRCRNESWVAEWMFEDESTCVSVGTALESIEDGEVILMSVSPS
jgi:hypothetical protein